jgi:hypothetical protein
MYLPGTAGRVRKRATVRAASYEEAVRLWSAFRSRAAEGIRRQSPEVPTFSEFINDYFSSIEANVARKTATDYRYGIDRHLLPQLGALRLTEITSGVLNHLGANLKATGYAGATVNKYMTLAGAPSWLRGGVRRHRRIAPDFASDGLPALQQFVPTLPDDLCFVIDLRQKSWMGPDVLDQRYR